jgi:hypothetical protein
MATVQTVLDSARYDLGDFETGLEFDDVELLDYMNRMVGIMDTTLAKLNSDLVYGTEEDIDTVASQAYIDISSMNSGNWIAIKTVWIGSDQLTQISLDRMYTKRKWFDSDAQGNFWALEGTNILFETGMDSAHTDVTIHYQKKTAALAVTDSMPYNDIFNEFLREMVVSHAKAKREGAIGQGEQIYGAQFKRRAMEETIRRGFVAKPYVMDF